MFPSKLSILSGAFKNNHSIIFDGTDDSVTVVDHDDFTFGDGSTTDSAFSVSAWINITALVSNRFPVVMKSGSANLNSGVGNIEWIFNVDTNMFINLFIDDGGTTTYQYMWNTTVMSTGVWYHVVGTYDGRGGTGAAGGLNVYVNAVLARGAGGTNGTYAAMHNLDSTLNIGKGCNGMIDSPAVFNIELSQAQVIGIYNLGAPTDLTGMTGLVGYWPFEEGSGTTSADLSGNNHIATLTNDATWSSNTPR